MDSLQEANVVALLVQAVLYGVYLALVMLTLRFLMFQDRGWELRRNINKLMLSTTILFFVSSTSDLFLSLRMNIAAIRGQTMTYNKYGTVNNAIENATILMADAVLIYRCWLVYARSSWVIFPPVLMWLAALFCSVLVICSQLIISWEPRFYRLWVVFYCSNILTNVYATAAIIYKIFKTEKHAYHRGLHNASRILFDSGFLYALASSLNLGSSIVGGPPVIRYVSDAVNFSMTGITFNLILIRVSLHRRYYDARDSIAISHLSVTKLKSPSHTSELSTPTTSTSNKGTYV